MPIYEYQCESCLIEFEMLLFFSEYKDPQVCPTCGKPAKKLVSLGDFVLKGDGWYGKALKIKGQMKKKNERILARQKDRYHGTGASLQPNVDGQPVDTWKDAQKLAADKGKVAETYTPMVEKEKRGES